MVSAQVDVSESLQNGLTEVVAFLPELVAAIVIVVVGWFVAKLLGKLVARVLHRVGLDRTLHEGPGGEWIRRAVTRPSSLFGTITFWAVMLGAISLAVSVLGIAALTAFVAAIWGYLPNVIAAIAIFIVAGMIAAGISGLATRTMGDTSLGRIVATAAPILVMTIATFMILNQLQIAPAIVTITYAGLVGAIALASALAFGLGGRAVAGRMLEGAYEEGREKKDEFKQDLDRGMERGREQLDDARTRTPTA